MFRKKTLCWNKCPIKYLFTILWADINAARIGASRSSVSNLQSGKGHLNLGMFDVRNVKVGLHFRCRPLSQIRMISLCLFSNDQGHLEQKINLLLKHVQNL